MMNKGTSDSTRYNYLYSFPSDLLAIERGMPPESGYQKWHTSKAKNTTCPAKSVIQSAKTGITGRPTRRDPISNWLSNTLPAGSEESISY